MFPLPCRHTATDTPKLVSRRAVGADSRSRLGIALRHTVRLDLNEPIRIDEALDLYKGAGALDLREHFAMSASGFLPARDVCQHPSLPDDLVHGGPHIRDRLSDDLVAALRLSVNCPP